MHAIVSSTQFRATILMLCYNQVAFVEQAALSCLAQECEGLEIIFSDDSSNDGSYEILCKIVRDYQGPHSVSIRQNSCNLGIANHYNYLINIARSNLLITAAGDDVSHPHRARLLIEAWNSTNCQTDLLASYAFPMSLNGQLSDNILRVDNLALWVSPEDWCRKRPFVIGATHAFTKRLWTRFGDIASDVSYEDQVMSFRAACLGGGVTVFTPLVSYREGGLSAKVSGESKIERLASLANRYQKQQAVYRQIHNDLYTINRGDLWRGKVKRYFNRAEAFLLLLQLKKQGNGPFSTFKRFWFATGIFWILRQIFYIWR